MTIGGLSDIAPIDPDKVFNPGTNSLDTLSGV